MCVTQTSTPVGGGDVHLEGRWSHRPGRNVYLTSWFILSVLVVVRHHVNVYLTSWFILSVLAGGEMCVVTQIALQTSLVGMST